MATGIRSKKTGYLFRATLFCLAFTLLFVVFSFFKHSFPAQQERLVHGLMGTAAALITTFFFLRWDQKPFRDIGLFLERRTPLRFLAGVLAGLLIMGALALSLIWFSGAAIEVNTQSHAGHFLLATLPLLPLAYMEELGFRAYPLQLLQKGLGTRPAILVTSILFALYHIANGWTVASSFLGPAVWGLVFGLAAIYSRGIAMPTGLHYAANLTTAALATTPNDVSIWTVKFGEGAVGSMRAQVWLPSLALLLFAVLCIEWYMRRRPLTHLV